MKRLSVILAVLCHFTISQAQFCPFPSSYSMYDVFFSAGCDNTWYEIRPSGMAISRNAVMQDQMDFHVPPIPSTLVYTNPDDDTDTQVYDVEVRMTFFPADTNNSAIEVNPTPQTPESNITYNFNLDPGKNRMFVEILLYDYDWSTEYWIHRVVKNFDIYYNANLANNNDYQQDFGYVQPDITWNLNTSNFSPPSCNPYPTDPNHFLAKYSGQSSGEAKAYIRLGEGNTVLTRPLIFVEGIDFDETEILDPNTGEVVRYGATGWENIIQGVGTGTPSTIDDGNGGTIEIEDGLFKNYPGLLDDIRKDAEPGEANYDIILLDFKDGADYIQKNGQLLIELIKKVNDEKVCGYDNVVTGLSMGGQVARYALAKMESDGENHESRMYISFDSPHLGANIPLALQAFVWFNATWADWGTNNSSVIETWYGLNKPAAQQMLYETFFNSWQDGHLNVEVTQISPEFLECDFEEDDFEDITPLHLLVGVDHGCLREQYKNEMNNLGYPKETFNVAMANGSGNAVDQGLSPGGLLMDVDIDYNGSILQSLGNCLADAQFKLHMNALNGSTIENNRLLWFRIPYQINHLIEIKVNLTQPDFYPPYDVLPGGKRFDMRDAVLSEFTALKQNPPSNVAQVLILAAQHNTCFMPTSSVVGFETDDFNSNLEDIFESSLDETPFDLIYFPVAGLNEQHVEVNLDNIGFIDDNEGLNLPDQPSFLPQPVPFGDSYNFGLYHKKIISCDINFGGTMLVNQLGTSSYINGSTEHQKDPTIKSSFSATITGIACDAGAAEVNVNDGGQFILGDETINSVTKSAQVFVARNSELNVTDGGEIKINADSELIIKKDGKTIINDGGLISLRDNGNLIIQDGGLLEIYPGGQIFATGSSSIVVEKGGMLIIHPGTNIHLDQPGSFFESELLNPGSHILLSGTLLLEGGEFSLEGNGYLQLEEGNQILLNDAFKIIMTGHGKNGAISLYNNTQSRISDNILFDQSNIVNNGTIEFYFQTFIDFEDCSGIGGIYKYRGAQSSELRNCDFHQSAHEVHDLGNFSASDSKFFGNAHYSINTYKPCILAEHASGLYLRDCEFYENKRSIVSNQTDYQILLSGVNFYNHNIENLAHDDLVYGGINLYNTNDGAIILNNQATLNMYNVDLDDAPIGILCPFGANVLMKESSSIRNCPVGICMYGNEDLGLVDMDCSSLIDNEVGIMGLDVLLNIDAFEIALASDCELRSNSFISDAHSIRDMFRINYVNREIPIVHAKGNYWRTGAPNGNLVNYAIYNGSTPILVDHDLNVPDQPMSCAPYQSNCINGGPITTNGIPYLPLDSLGGGLISAFNYVPPNWLSTLQSVYAPAYLTYIQYYSGGYYNPEGYEADWQYYQTSLLPLKDVAELTCENYYYTVSSYIRNRIDVARSLVGRECIWITNREMKTETINPALLFPNPATNQIQIDFSEQYDHLKIMDVTGQVLITNHHLESTSISIDVDDLRPGVYFTELTNATNGHSTVLKWIKM